MSDEIWRDIEGYEGLYQVSSMGNVKSLERNVMYKAGYNHHVPERILKQQIVNGYCLVALCKQNTITRFGVHRLVASAFLPKIEGKTYVNHKDANRTNNQVSNLEWCTQKENVRHSIENNLRSRDRRSRRVVRSDGVEFESMNQAAVLSDIAPGNLWSHLHGKRNHVGGYTFKFKE